MASIISALIIILLILLFTIFAAWTDRFGAKRKEAFIDKTVDKAIDKTTSKLIKMIEEYKTGPWYLVVYTTTQGHPIWISNNNIRSVHPDQKNSRLIIKQFNGEDMVIEDVESYDLQAANEMADFDL